MTYENSFPSQQCALWSDKNYNALRTAIQLQKQDQNIKIWVYLMSDSITGAMPGQKEKTGQYNMGKMLTNIIYHGGEVKLCTSCAESRGVSSVIPGAIIGTLQDLTNWIVTADRVLTF